MKELLIKRAKMIMLSGAIVLSAIGSHHVLDNEAIAAPKYSILAAKGGGVEFYTNVSRESAQEVVRYLQETDRKRQEARLYMYSYGGSATDLHSILVAMDKRKHKTITVVEEVAYSAAATIFMNGDDRYVSRFAIVGFHGDRLGDASGNQLSVKRQYYTLISKEFNNTLRMGRPDDSLTTEEKLLHINLLTRVMQSGYPAVLEFLKARHDFITKRNDMLVLQISQKIGWTTQKTREVLFNNFETDVVFTGQELIDLGLAKDLRELKQ